MLFFGVELGLSRISDRAAGCRFRQNGSDRSVAVVAKVFGQSHLPRGRWNRANGLIDDLYFTSTLVPCKCQSS